MLQELLTLLISAREVGWHFHAVAVCRSLKKTLCGLSSGSPQAIKIRRANFCLLLLRNTAHPGCATLPIFRTANWQHQWPVAVGNGVALRYWFAGQERCQKRT